MRNVHIRVARDPDPLSFDAYVNATGIAISILVDRDTIFLLRVNGVKVDAWPMQLFKTNTIKLQLL